jgi:hypothetical protein
MDFYSRVFDQRMSIIGKNRNRIMMGQTRQTSDDLTEHEERTGVPLDISLNQRTNHTSQAVSMVPHVTWLHWQRML